MQRVKAEKVAKDFLLLSQNENEFTKKKHVYGKRLWHEVWFSLA